MRGDSLRDFYAKTLAVVGLGLLAGAGALIDYWPANGEIPVAPRVGGLTAAAPVLLQNLSLQIPAPVLSMPRPRPAGPADFVVAEPDLRAVDVAEPVVAVALRTAPLPQDFVAVRPIPASSWDEALGLAAPPLPDGMTEESRGLFGDAMHRTKERIVAARVLINDAMTGVVGAFRKMSPFFSTTATAIVPGLD